MSASFVIGARVVGRCATTFIHTNSQCMRASSGLRSSRVALRKRFGQHFLTNQDTVRRIVESAELSAYESVFEIGPGSGNLTMHLLNAAHTVYAVELDDRVADILVSRVAKAGMLARSTEAAGDTDRPPLADRLRLFRGDFLRCVLPPFHAVVANIPYQISSPVLRRLLGHAASLARRVDANSGAQIDGAAVPQLSRIVLMLQLEFAQRMVARPGSKDYCRLSVNTSLLSDSVIVMKIGREQFRPPPKVDSAVIKIVPKHPSAWSGLDLVQWDGMLKLAFAGKNKTLRASMAGNKHVLARLGKLRQGQGAGIDGADMTDMVDTSEGPMPRSVLIRTRDDLTRCCRAALAYDPADPNSGEGARANGLSLAQFRHLYDALAADGFRFVDSNGTGAEADEDDGLLSDGGRPRAMDDSHGPDAKGRFDTGPITVWNSHTAGQSTIDRYYLTADQHLGARPTAAVVGTAALAAGSPYGSAAPGARTGIRTPVKDSRTGKPLLLYPQQSAAPQRPTVAPAERQVKAPVRRREALLGADSAADEAAEAEMKAQARAKARAAAAAASVPARGSTSSSRRAATVA